MKTNTGDKQMDKKKNGIPKLRFPGFTGAWEQRELGEVVEKSTIKNSDLEYSKEDILSVATMSDMSFSRDINSTENYMKTYNKILYGEIAFEGHSNKKYRFGRFVLNDYRNGIVSHIYDIYKIIIDYDMNFMKEWISLDRVMYKPLVNSTTSARMMNSLQAKKLYKQKVLLPDLQEQKEIGNFLNKFDTLIALHQRKLDHLKEQKTGLLQKMFPKKGEAVPEVRFPVFTDAWEQRKLGEVGKTQSGVGFPNKEQGGHQGIPFFKVSDMNNEGNELEMKISNNYVTEIQITNRKWKPISAVPAVIFAKVGAALMLNRKRLVKVPFLIDNNTMAYIFNKKWDPYFGKILFDTLNLPRYAQIGALPSFNGSDIENIKVMLPSLEEQQTLSQFFQKINSLIALHQRKLDHLQLLKKGLLQQMFV